MSTPTTERRATEVAALHAEGVAGLDRAIERVRQAIEDTERAKRGPLPRVTEVIERHPAPTKREWPAWAERVCDWALALALGIGLGWLAAKGF